MSFYPVNISYANPGNYCRDGGCDFNMNSVYDRLREDDFQNILIITILLGILSCVGSLGNLCVLIVFSLRFQQRTSTYFILSLATIDFIICVFVIPGLIVKTWYHQFYFDWLCKLWEMFRMYSLPTSAFLLVAIASDRYFLICMATNKIMTKRRAKLIIFTIAILGVGLSIPPLLAVGVYEIDDDGSQMYRGICIENYWLISVQGLHSYWIFVTTLFCIMMLLIAVLYTKIFMTVYRQDHRWRRRNQRNKVFPPSQNKGDTTDQTQTAEFQKTEMDSVSFPAGTRRLQTNDTSVTGVHVDRVIHTDISKIPCTDIHVTGDRVVHFIDKTKPNHTKRNNWMTDKKQSSTKLFKCNNSRGFQPQNMDDTIQNVIPDPTKDYKQLLVTASQGLQSNEDFRADSSASSQCEENDQNVTNRPSPSGSLLTMGPSSLPETPQSTSAANGKISSPCFPAALTPGLTCDSCHTCPILPGVADQGSTDSPTRQSGSLSTGPTTKTTIPKDGLQSSIRQSEDKCPQNLQNDHNGYMLSYRQCTCSIQLYGSTENKLQVPEVSSMSCSRVEWHLKNSCSVCNDLDEQRRYLPGSTMSNELTCSCIPPRVFFRPYRQAGSSTSSTQISEDPLPKASVNEQGYNCEAITTLSVENLTDLSDRRAGLVKYPDTDQGTPEHEQAKPSHASVSHSATNKPNSARSPSQHNAHIKMARVVFMVTLVYVVSFLPTFLVSYQVIENEAIFYVYFINNAANPIIYSFMNRKFRAEVKGLLKGFFSKFKNHCSWKN